MPHPLSKLRCPLLLLVLASAAGAQNIDWKVPLPVPTPETVVTPDLDIDPANYYTVSEYETAFNEIDPNTGETYFSGSGFDNWIVVQRIPPNEVPGAEVKLQWPGAGTQITAGEFMHLLVDDIDDGGWVQKNANVLVPLLIVILVVVGFRCFALSKRCGALGQRVRDLEQR
jgi:hypothetical protein